MVNFALVSQFGYSAPSQNEEPDLMRSPDLYDLNLRDDQDAINESVSATSAGTQVFGEGSIDASFDSRAYGAAKDADALSAGVNTTEGYASDADREKPVDEREASPEVANLTAYQKLLGKGFSHDQVYAAQTLGFSNEQMLGNVQECESKGENLSLVPKDKQQELASREQVNQMMQDKELRMVMNEGEMAQSGPQAVTHGLYASYGAAQMIGSEMMRA